MEERQQQLGWARRGSRPGNDSERGLSLGQGGSQWARLSNRGASRGRSRGRGTHRFAPYRVSMEQNPNHDQVPRSGKDCTCFHCKKLGYIEVDCWIKYLDKRPKRDSCLGWLFLGQDTAASTLGICTIQINVGVCVDTYVYVKTLGGRQWARALIDGGTEGNFVNYKFVKSHELWVTSVATMVQAVDGHWIPTFGKMHLNISILDLVE
jgi:hypothetical protein